MTTPTDCAQNTDPLKLIREGSSQDQRLLPALKPAYAPVDEHKTEHAMVFAKAYAKHLQFYGANNSVTGDWQPFFNQDAAVQLAIAAQQDIDYYKSTLKAWFDFLNMRENALSAKEPELKQNLGLLFAALATLAKQLDVLKDALPAHIHLKTVLQNQINTQLAPAFKRLIAYFKAGIHLNLIDSSAAHTLELEILGSGGQAFEAILAQGLSGDWSAGRDWEAFLSDIDDAQATWIYGEANNSTAFARINYLANHNLFTGIFDQFLKIYARTVLDARQALQQALSNQDDHEPHYALFLSFLQLLNHVRNETNTLTQRHLDFYYREILRLKEKPAQPGHAHLLVTLAKQADTVELKAGTLFKAGKDASGKEAYFAGDQDFIANRAKVTALKTLYKHLNTDAETLSSQDQRLFASPQANSADGLGAALSSADESWHPFFNKTYQDGVLTKVHMPPAEIGFALASHYFLMAEGQRTITLDFTVDKADASASFNSAAFACYLSGKKDWLTAEILEFSLVAQNLLRVSIMVDASAPAISAYASKIHGYRFDTGLPVLLLKLVHQENADFVYAALADIRVQKIDLSIKVQGLKTLAISNDFGAVDASKPFQPFGAIPAKSSSLIIGCKEMFQKKLSTGLIKISWQNPPKAYKNKAVSLGAQTLHNNEWHEFKTFALDSPEFALDDSLTGAHPAFIDAADLSAQELFNTGSRYGFVRLVLSDDFGQQSYEQDLIDYIGTAFNRSLEAEVQPEAAKDGQVTATKPIQPSGPFITDIKLDYTASQTLALSENPAGFEARPARFFHLAPFGHAEQHACLKTGLPEPNLTLLPQFRHLKEADKLFLSHEAELYIGISELKPPQNLALFVQVADGTADPLALKPAQHIHWSVLCNNEWLPLALHEVQDGTGGLINSGIITVAVPAQASASNTLLPAGQYWLRAAVSEKTDAVCRLIGLAAQGFTVTFKNQGNAPDFPAKPLPPASINKLDQPEAAIKEVSQPFTGFGGKAAEEAEAFYTRISERLRHKDRALALWDYEHLILEAFPQIYKVNCLNHTQYEPTETGGGIYRELAPGHVTLLTLPNQQFQHLRDPLRPYTSLGLLKEIEQYLQNRVSVFVQLHVKNPLFEEISTEFKVQFLGGVDESFYKNLLQEAITRFLSPWAFSNDSKPTFGGKIYASVLINFIEEQSYVDYVTDFVLFHHPVINGLKQKQPKIEVEGSKAVSILVSVPAKQHGITVINPAEIQISGENCPCAA